MDENVRRYQESLRDAIDRIYSVGAAAREKSLDPRREVEAMPAGDLAARVEGLVGPEGIADKIRSLGRDNLSDIVDFILEAKSGEDREAQIEQALRTSLAILTEGVVAAPIEGISGVKVRENPDGSEYLSIYFAGPIRSAGGTAQGLACLVGDYIRTKIGLLGYRPTGDEVERYVEEIKLYDERASRLQYMPSEDEIRKIVSKLAVCVDGDPTEVFEVAIHRDLKRVDSNRIRGGMCLVIAEGLAQKSLKVMRHADKLGLDWSWLGELKKNATTSDEHKPKAKFMDEVVGGRPIFSAPSAKGGFRLRYGHSRCNGIAGKSMHPATLILLDDFIATGTQVKVEKPGKGCIVTECDTIDGPVVLLEDGSVRRVESRSEAYEMKDRVKEIMFLGDILVSYGDFLQTNTKLIPSGYVEEWWSGESGVNEVPSPDDAVRISMEGNIPLHPRYTYHWCDIRASQLKTLVDWLATGELDGSLSVDNNDQTAKRVLEELGVPHEVREGKVVIDEAAPLMVQLGLEGLDRRGFDKALTSLDEGSSGYDLVCKACKVPVRKKVGSYIGCRMGRPEKARERKMQPAVHGLFPIGNAGGRERSINAAVERNRVEVEVSQFVCPQCRRRMMHPFCRDCNAKAVGVRFCRLCGYAGDMETCPKCNVHTRQYSKTHVELKSLWDEAIRKVGKSTTVKGVMGMISESKIPEPVEKGLLRALNGIYVFKDGTSRFDATDAPLTHFRPAEIGMTVEGIRELGYVRDWKGEELVSDGQVVELMAQDIIVSEYCGTYLVRIAKFVDELLRKFYGMEAFYNVDAREEMIGHLVAGLAPHTSAAVVGRIIGYTKANVCYAHPFWHAAKRRNCDGDEDSIMLLLDVLLNFSRSYLPQKRGGKMDAPLVVTTIMDPREIDDEAHKMEIVTEYGKEFYLKTLEEVNPSDVDVKVVQRVLDENPFESIGFTHDTSDVTGPVTSSRYVTLKTMHEKMEAQLAVAEKIRAIDEKEVAEIVINSHFLRDTYGNLRAFSRQRFRCVKCNENYRRVPLAGKCKKCGGRLLLTVSAGNITKYLRMSMDMAEKYQLSEYLKSRLRLLEKDVESLTVNDLEKQVSLADFM
ncbi:MAG: DNA polymerase II large subunit [Candidatus Altiarchaeales archaeon]|nr:DNA polymerase II large subunit [Candidatus Altiarchaeales archaeon]MBD3416277.1 DNA polymerase II large subunit [Candidatus Altiarchaeales archaeon]